MLERERGLTQGERARIIAEERGYNWRKVKKHSDLLRHFLEQACSAGGLSARESDYDGPRWWEGKKGYR